MKAIREYVRLVLEEKRRHAEMSEDEDLLVEPDEANEKEIEENPLATIATALSIAASAKSLASGESKKDDLLGEPDFADETDESVEIEKEVSAGGVVGVTTPLGSGPTYPNKTRKRKKAKKN